ncbi:lipopolysaccharide assembly protein LapA domain-containing protein [Thalassotalea eurytherma]|uniref:Lipopolysaccharide assembly protein A domain-containing protein n=1 Tax=Thalassotalea eurytherma TaxID=1144278 RepID=A0ABQ6H1F7_9GAMM|nr:lipopolysaccharide assembly protein LapA domain-containing protein [Thalassotalea eurytherma]GLX81942.1 hypothetical protein theurythT_13940 [Thalassotalea eurytherma]
MRLVITLLILFALLVIAFAFGSQNNGMITLNYFIARTEMSIASAVSLFTFIGFLLGIFTTVLWRLLSRMKKRLK